MDNFNIIESLETRFESTDNSSEKLALMELLSYYYVDINKTHSNGFIIPSTLHCKKKAIRPLMNGNSNRIEYARVFYHKGVESKICKDCNTINNIYWFYKSKDSITGRMHICKVCFRKKYQL